MKLRSFKKNLSCPEGEDIGTDQDEPATRTTHKKEYPPSCFLFPEGSFKHVTFGYPLLELSGKEQDYTIQYPYLTMKLSFANFVLSTTFILASTLIGQAIAHDGEHKFDYEWKTLDVTLPKSLSDHTATVASDGLIYIAGGCGKSVIFLSSFVVGCPIFSSRMYT